MKKDIFKKITNVSLATLLAMSMLSSSVFAQGNVIDAHDEIQALAGGLSDLSFEANFDGLIEPIEAIPIEFSTEIDNSIEVSLEARNLILSK